MIDIQPRCPVCREPSHRSADAPGWGEWRTCDACTLEFVNPLALPERPEALFEDAYQGRRAESRMEEFHERLDQRRLIRRDPSLWFWSPAYRMIIDWLKQRLEPGATTLEIGCALGFVMQALRRAGFNPTGLDVAETAVELNRRDGFRVWHGELATMPADWVQPQAVMAFFMLHHPVDPVGLLRNVRARWPAAPIAIAQYGRNNAGQGGVYSSPPRTLFRWNAQSLRRALEVAGYTPEVISLASTGTESSVLNPLRRVLSWTPHVPPLHRLRLRIANSVLPSVMQAASQQEWVLVAFGEPAAGRSPDRTGGSASQPVAAEAWRGVTPAPAGAPPAGTRG